MTTATRREVISDLANIHGVKKATHMVERYHILTSGKPGSCNATDGDVDLVTAVRDVYTSLTTLKRREAKGGRANAA